LEIGEYQGAKTMSALCWGSDSFPMCLHSASNKGVPISAEAYSH